MPKKERSLYSGASFSKTLPATMSFKDYYAQHRKDPKPKKRIFEVQRQIQKMWSGSNQFSAHKVVVAYWTSERRSRYQPLMGYKFCRRINGVFLFHRNSEGCCGLRLSSRVDLFHTFDFKPVFLGKCSPFQMSNWQMFRFFDDDFSLSLKDGYWKGILCASERLDTNAAFAWSEPF